MSQILPILQKMNVDVSKRNVSGTDIVKQGDILSRNLHITLCDKGRPIVVEQGVAVLLNITRPDGFKGGQGGSVNEDGSISVVLPVWALTVTGHIKCSVSLIDADERKLTSSSFTKYVEKLEYDGSEVTEDDNFNILVDLISQVAAINVVAEQAKTDAQGFANQAEQSKIRAEGYANQAEQSKIRAEDAAVDISTTKKQVKDLTQTIQQSNLSGEDKISTEGYGTLGLPKNATGYCGVELNGNLLENLAENGDFSNDMAGWIPGVGAVTEISTTKYIYSGKSLKIIASNSYTQVMKNVNLIDGNKYYLSVYCKNETNENVYAGVSGQTIIPSALTFPANTDWVRKSGTFTKTNTETKTINLGYTAVVTDNGVRYFDGVILINLTAFGMESFTLSQIDLMTDLYFEGTQSAMVSRVSSITTGGAKQEQYIKPYPLYRLPNGTDNDIVNGKYTGRVKKRVLTADDVLDIYTENEGLEIVSIAKPIDYIGYNNLLYPTAFKLDGYISTTDISTSVGLVGTNWNVIKFGVSMAKGTTLEQAKIALTGVALYYELAEQYYTIDNNIATGLLNANPNGTIYFDNGFADAGIYNDGITILNQDYPIEELETLLILNNDGSHTRLDPSTATIALDGKSFTHAGLTNGDIIAFTYKGADSPLKGLNKVTYLDSKNVIADTANGKFYKYKPVVTNGVIASWTLTEV